MPRGEDPEGRREGGREGVEEGIAGLWKGSGVMREVSTCKGGREGGREGGRVC